MPSGKGLSNAQAERSLRQSLAEAGVRGQSTTFASRYLHDSQPRTARSNESQSDPLVSRTNTGSNLLPSTSVVESSADIALNPYAMRNGRRYLRDSSFPYPLPYDLPELHRQNLRTMLLTSVFGSPICSPFDPSNPPTKVLEVACGTGLYSSMCHDYFAGLGHPQVSFTGIDIVPLSADLQKQGINWKFIQHDLRTMPLPFQDEEFDLVVSTDISIVLPFSGYQERLIAEELRILKPGGMLEIWESDHVLRTLLRQPPKVPNVSQEAQGRADATATYPIFASTPFVVTQNPFVREYNTWIQSVLDSRKLCAVPCTLIKSMLLQETEHLEAIGTRRLAVMLGDVRWEREGVGDSSTERSTSSSRRKAAHGRLGKQREDSNGSIGVLTAEQSAIRKTALLTIVQLIESLEPLLKEASGKIQAEWDRWWAGMMTDFFEQRGMVNGECIEVGAWWGRKR
ncbi:MAG: hypothetical protein M1812_000155 [Candelaria pacifica]|nr:MAG: hypothetical protein M1812_000155 [Candelaria pacifica]